MFNRHVEKARSWVAQYGGRLALSPDEAVISAIEGGAAGSWQLSHRARSMLVGEFDFGFALDWMVKDLGYALDESVRVGAVALLNRAVLVRYQALQGKGLGRLDTSALIRALDLE
ncbi:NAD-binding protein [Rappaport israeli]|uniref:NAD-binding protein n=1 Tax=Rappaport israeli TaxID=1839807 RepID=UPI000930A0A1|nr:NAD-binding protein [Rappaport israeli]